ncbi:proline-, glutamic acid- and leucine-rich protein 1 isoform X2 [Iris pallida]|uniref:Proline-, glutamic acid- and leucine-rich protein 1 isoform X2 n=1 Tax=Iris pallida TaxID=29817 RepID=A0AAX6DJI6_IRIPA|nr:proline-, glutamic acid- and leucine-rich protein 1 isoform X2 [Iris pallida]
MTTSDYVNGMNDPRLRPRILRSVARDLLPDDKRPFPSSSELSLILSYVKTHGILTERHSQPSDRKLIDGWRSAVDEWVDRLLSLVSSNMPDKCWAGISLLGVTCEECSSDRFLASYTLWFQKLLSNIQPPSSTHFVKLASCATLADFFTRLAVFPNLKKDATSLAGKLIQPILHLLNENGTESVWEGAINLLCTLITLFPSSMLRHYDSIETVIVSRIMSAKCSGDMSKKFAYCLALLPKVRGDEDSWFLLMQKILISINMHIDDAFQGLEATAPQHMRLLVPPGKEPPPPLGGHLMPEPSEQATTKLRELLVPRVSTLMHCCCIMLTNPYPVQVTVPIHLLLALVGRVLRVDGSLHGSLLQFTTAMHQELLCAELPVFHMDSLDLLIAVIKGVRSQFLPHAANVARLLTDYLRRAALPSIRIKVYSIMHILLISMGVGMALYLAQDIINNASVDLNDCPGSGSFSSRMCSSRLASEVSVQTSRRKRKHVSGWPMEQPDSTDAGVDSLNRNMLTPLSVKIAALRALEALLTVGGSLRSESWRSNVDHLLITVATNACDAGWGIEGKCLNLIEGPPLLQGDFQLAALEALLASLLSPSHMRPPYLAQGLELFRRGKQETGTRVAAFCAHALLALEVLIHPRALPLVDAPVANSSANDEGFKQGHQKFNIPSFLLDVPLFIDDYENDDDLEETALNGLRIKSDMENTEQLLEGYNKAAAVEKDVVKAVRGDDIVEGRQNQIHSSDVEMTCTAGEENVEPNKEPSTNDMVDVRKTDVSVGSGSDLNRDYGATTDLVPALFSRDDMEPVKGHVVSSSSSAKVVSNGFESLVASEKERMPSYDSDSTSGSLPSIVDVDPDSDPDFD